MSLTPEQELFRQSIINFNKGEIPEDYPKEGYLSAKYLSGIIDAINFNLRTPFLLSFELYFKYSNRLIQLNYMPFDIYPNAIQLPNDFVFDYSNTDRNQFESNNSYRNKIEDANIVHKFAHEFGYNPYYLKSPGGMFYTSAFTKKNHHIQPIHLETKLLNYLPNKIQLHNILNIPQPIDNNDYTQPHWTWKPLKYSFDTGQNVNQVTPLLIKTFKNIGSTVNGITGVNPLDGFETVGDFSTFWGGGVLPYWGKDPYECFDNGNYSSLGHSTGFFYGNINIDNWNPYTSRFVGYRFYKGFELLDYQDNQILIQNKYLLVYRDRLEQSKPKLKKCCLLDCIKK